MPKQILSTSCDAAVLRTRNLIMEGAGYEVSTTRDPDVFLHLLHERHYDAAVIGDSVKIEMRVDLVKRAKALKPSLPLVVFSRTFAESQLLCDANYLVEALGPTEQFLSALKAALTVEVPLIVATVPQRPPY